MKFKKIPFLLAIATLVFSSMAFVGVARADNDDDFISNKNLKEIHAKGASLEVHLYDNGKVAVKSAKESINEISKKPLSDEEKKLLIAEIAYSIKKFGIFAEELEVSNSKLKNLLLSEGKKESKPLRQ